MARWKKKQLVFHIRSAQDQMYFIDLLKRKIKYSFQIQADPRGITVTLRGDPEQVRKIVERSRALYRIFQEDTTKNPSV